ncbi:hypothetical protein L208DRAFT_559920 [Tricholoma matsutake]|nr:hypothetical protein L208DRAFT_559920 [Tricholoma matsutake 945]
MYFSHSSFSPPFHHATSCPTRHRADAMGSTRRSSDRKRALNDPPLRVRRTPLIIKGKKRGAGLGFSMAYGESPQKIGLWGCETSRGKETRLTMSALSFPQLTHILSRIFFTFTMKPFGGWATSVRLRMVSHCTARTRMEDRSCQLNMTKMARTLRHPFTTSLTLEIPVNGAHPRIHESAQLGLVGGFVHDFWMFNFGDGVSFLCTTKIG